MNNWSDYEPEWAVKDRPAAPLGIEVTVPSGYEYDPSHPVIAWAGPSGTEAPDGGALVLGWTSYWAALYSDPCFALPDQVGDMPVGPTVDDFVNAVVTHPKLNVSNVRDAQFGEYQGKSFTLTLPSDISKCDSWQPWDPSFYAQGDNNIWDVRVADADGFRVVIVAEYFSGTPQTIKSDLDQMSDSITFVPGAQ